MALNFICICGCDDPVVLIWSLFLLNGKDPGEQVAKPAGYFMDAWPDYYLLIPLAFTMI